MTLPKLLPRDPSAEQRTRYFIDKVREILNSLILDGTIQEIRPGVWVLTSTDENILANQIFGS